ncbi:hypothetical protein [Marinagarivorans algicola]|uniref:hypothetical protein n=1 Tax=Marinagarivorans algicola TaxID=1513270 RepID=UPI0006B950AA|nr:hypothetical protein [Marinagarivorans algicola]
MSVSSLSCLAKGEKAMPAAPFIDAGGGQLHLPQHYMTYRHNLGSVRTVLSKITFTDDVLLFAATDDMGLYLQVGIIGHENYQKLDTHYPPKIVYGRKWRIDTDTPTSEIIQTAMLAIKKVMEHEIRELLTLTTPNKATTTQVRSAPLSSHQDMGMLQKAAKYALGIVTKNAPRSNTEQALIDQLSNIHFANHHLQVAHYTALNNDRAFIDLNMKKDNAASSQIALPAAFEHKQVSIMVRLEEISGIMYTLLDELIAISDRYVEEHFAYENFYRFSRTISPAWLAQQSLVSRPYTQHMQDKIFKRTFETLNFATDTQRKPDLGSGLLAEINTQKLLQVDNLNGHLPKGFTNAKLKQA